VSVGKRVLVVDDETTVLEVLIEALEQDGYTVQGAADGEAALAGVDAFHPDLVILDVIMPKENGYRVSRQVKSSEGTPPKILLVTGRRLDDDPDRESMFMEFSMADGILYKPFELDRLLSRVGDLLRDGPPDGA
jgi:DNA-binding response OmpR family regulator